MDRTNTQALTPDEGERYARVLELRRVGLTFDQIAKEVGYSGRQGAKEAYDAAIARMGRDAAEDLRLLENDRLDDLWRRAYTQMTRIDSDDVDSLTKLELTLLRISQRRAGLMGLDAPRQLEVAANLNISVHGNIGDILRERIGLAKAGETLPLADDAVEGGEPQSFNGQQDE